MIYYDDHEEKLLDLVKRLSITSTLGAVQNQRLVFGGVRGSGGGGGGPVQTFIGKLKQTDITFDVTESGNILIPVGEAATLLNNLNRIRFGHTIKPGYIPYTYTVPSGLTSNLNDHLYGIDNALATISGGGSGGHTIQDEGTPLTQRTNLNFVGASVAVTDDAGNDATKVVISFSGGGGGHTIQNEGISLPQRTNLNFVGPTVNVTDSAGTDSSIVTISGLSGWKLGNAIVVSNSGDGDYTTIAAAFAAAAPGSIILIDGGVSYTCNDEIVPNGCLLIGFGRETPVLQNTVGGNVLRFTAGAFIANMQLLSNINNGGGTNSCITLPNTGVEIRLDRVEMNATNNAVGGNAELVITGGDTLHLFYCGGAAIGDQPTHVFEDTIGGEIYVIGGNYTADYAMLAASATYHFEAQPTFTGAFLPAATSMPTATGSCMVISEGIYTFSDLYLDMDQRPSVPSTPGSARYRLYFTASGLFHKNSAGVVTGPLSRGHTIQDEGTPLTQRGNLNFVGAGVTVTDDLANNATKVTISGSTGSSGGWPFTGRVLTVDKTDTDADYTTVLGAIGAANAIDTILLSSDVHIAPGLTAVPSGIAIGGFTTEKSIISSSAEDLMCNSNVTLQDITRIKTGTVNNIGIATNGAATGIVLRNVNIDVSGGSALNYGVHVGTSGASVSIYGGKIVATGTSSYAVNVVSGATCYLYGPILSGATGAINNAGTVQGWWYDTNGNLVTINGIPQNNLFVNGGVDIWQRSADDTTVTTTRKYVADRWAITTGGGTLAHVQRSSTVRTGHRSYYSMQLDGAGGVSTVDIDQRIEAIHTGYYKRQITFSAYIYNGSGAAFVPKLFASTPSAVDNWTTSTVRNGGGSGEDLQSCADAVWTQVYWTANVSGYTDINNGLEIRIRIPSGSLVAGDTVRFAEATLVPGPGIVPFTMPDYQQELARCQRYCYIANSLAQNTAIFGFGTAYSTTACLIQTWFPTSMRAAPTLATAGTFVVTDSVTSSACSVALAASNQQSELWASLNCTGASGLTQFRLYFLTPNTDTTARLIFTSEL